MYDTDRKTDTTTQTKESQPGRWYHVEGGFFQLHARNPHNTMNAKQPPTDWYRYDNGRALVPVLTIDGCPDSAMRSDSELALAVCAAALHANATCLTEAQLHHLEHYVAMQRWTR